MHRPGSVAVIDGCPIQLGASSWPLAALLRDPVLPVQSPPSRGSFFNSVFSRADSCRLVRLPSISPPGPSLDRTNKLLFSFLPVSHRRGRTPEFVVVVSLFSFGSVLREPPFGCVPGHRLSLELTHHLPSKAPSCALGATIPPRSSRLEEPSKKYTTALHLLQNTTAPQHLNYWPSADSLRTQVCRTDKPSFRLPAAPWHDALVAPVLDFEKDASHI
ncbi:hypothetical protein F5Y12DRAFT_721449 [Xylaria sp. FL1777]|nr:hypothetical protein F5Y12DRAFT_721449 [Xylaria sp. FL1777]